MSTMLSLSDTLPSTMLLLDSEGSNWVIFYIHFMDMIEVKGFWDHFDGSASPPSVSEPPTAAETAAKNQWDKDEHSAKALLTQWLPDSTVMEIHSKKTMKECWEAVVKKYTVKGVHAQMEIRAKFLMLRCPEKGNPREFLRGLRLKKEELVQVGVRISDKEYLSTIISLLPDVLANFVLMQMVWTLQLTSKYMDAGTLMKMLLSEAEQQNLQNQRCKPNVGKNKEEENREALVVSEDKPRGRKNSEGKILCWNCGKEGHLKLKCPELWKFKFNNNSKKASESSKPETMVATVSIVEVISDDEGAWAAEEVIVDLGKDWFEEVVEITRFELKLIEDVVGEKAGDGNMDETVAEELGDVSGEDFFVAEFFQTLAKAELYDSGCTNHISLYRSSFSNFKTIET